MGQKTYTKLDDDNLLITETVENKTIISKQSLLDQKAEIEKNLEKSLTAIDEALAEFTK